MRAFNPLSQTSIIYLAQSFTEIMKSDTHFQVSIAQVFCIASYSLINHFGSFSHTTSDPHPMVDFLFISLITGLHVDEKSKLVAVWIDFIRLLRISKHS